MINFTGNITLIVYNTNRGSTVASCIVKDQPAATLTFIFTSAASGGASASASAFFFGGDPSCFPLPAFHPEFQNLLCVLGFISSLRNGFCGGCSSPCGRVTSPEFRPYLLLCCSHNPSKNNGAAMTAPTTPLE